jgi:protein-disulfide isomerase
MVTFQPPLEALSQVAAEVGMTRSEFERCLDDKWLMSDFLNFARRGKEFGVASAPTFFVNGQKYSGALTIDQFDKILDRCLPGI